MCWIAECAVCDVPMVAWRRHGKTPPPEHLERMQARLHDVATSEMGEYYVDDDMRNIPDHWHVHARPKGGFFGGRRKPL